MMTDVKVIENFRGYEPPVRTVSSVKRLLASVAEEHLHGLGAIVLTNRSSLNHSRRRARSRSRGKKLALDQIRGFYHQARNGESAWIEIFVDGALDGVPKLALLIPVVCEAFLSEVLFHELGHHIHKTGRPEYREREDVADDWKKKLSRAYFRKRYWYLRPVGVAILFLWRKLKAR
jgi:hypothetical protein